MDNNGGVLGQEPPDASGGWCCACAPAIGVPTWHEAINLRAFQVGHGAFNGRVVGAGAKAALSALRTGADAVTGENFPTLVAEAGVRGERTPIRVGSSQGIKGVFVGEDAPE